MLLIIDIMRGKRIFQTELRGRRIEISMHMKLVKRLLSGGVFLFILAMGIQFLSLFLYPMNDIVRNWQSFYHLDKYSVDLLFVGSSHAYSSFDTAKIREYTGKEAYILASNSQNVVQSYFNVKEALKYQKPEVIILEAFSINDNDNWKGGENDDKDWKKETNIDGMRLGAVKVEAICSQYRPKNWAYAFFRIGRSHGNWADTSQVYSNYAFFRKGIKGFSPFRPSKSTMSEETAQKYEEAEKRDGDIIISETNIAYFHKLAGLCRSEGIEFYVVMAPMYKTYIDSINYESWLNRLLDLTKSEDIAYLDCNLHYDEIGLTASDFEDAYNGYHHLNVSGSSKVTDFLLKELCLVQEGR